MDQKQILTDILRGMGTAPEDWAPFFVTPEGPPPPDAEGFEEFSGYILTREDRAFWFWISWDASEKCPVLDKWIEVEPRRGWRLAREYCQARQKLGLPPIR